MVDCFLVPFCFRLFAVDVDAPPIRVFDEPHRLDDSRNCTGLAADRDWLVREPIDGCASTSGCGGRVGDVGAASLTETTFKNLSA